MKKIIICSFVSLLINSAFCAVLPLKVVLQIKPGASAKGLDTIGKGKDYSYELDVVDGKVDSLSIDFSPIISSDQFLKHSTKGFCLVQSASGDIQQNRFFFFNQDLNRRYEINDEFKIKSILLKDIPGARANKACQFGELVKLGQIDTLLKKVK
jgi:hypothetical protein